MVCYDIDVHLDDTADNVMSMIEPDVKKWWNILKSKLVKTVVLVPIINICQSDDARLKLALCMAI